jgi:hypothetical protein
MIYENTTHPAFLVLPACFLAVPRHIFKLYTAIISSPQTVVHINHEMVKTNIVFLTVTKQGLSATQLSERLLQVSCWLHVILSN